MSKSIEVLSRHKGKMVICTRKDEVREIIFEDKGEVGRAMVDADEAEILLNVGAETQVRTGFADFWKPGDGNKTRENEGGDGKAGNEDPKVLSPETYDAVKNVKELKGLLAACEDKALIMQLVSVEAQKGNDTNKAFMNALNARLDELQK